MGYDVRPLITLKEKAWFLELLPVKTMCFCFLSTMPLLELGSLENTDRGVRLDTTNLNLSEII